MGILSWFYSEPVMDLVSRRKWVTMDWAGRPITTSGDGYILPRRAEMVINGRYYPTGKIGEWPCDPDTGEKLPIEPMRR